MRHGGLESQDHQVLQPDQSGAATRLPSSTRLQDRHRLRFSLSDGGSDVNGWLLECSPSSHLIKGEILLR
jgi:hypothetical protein